ncbi:ThiJ/PfpI family protein [Penicillium lividum]|nr:ThiJ/PfpI family protein [Penicillium lividum]
MSHVSHRDDPDPIFEVKTIAQKNVVHTSSYLHIEPDIWLPDVLDSIAEYDILIVPDASLLTLQKMIKNTNTPELNLIRQYTSESTRSRVLLSVYTGALLLGAAGILYGLTVITHRLTLKILGELCSTQDQTKHSTKIVHRRFVDGEIVKRTKVQIISSGGMSASIDATFYIDCRLLSAEAVSYVSETMEYGWQEPQDGDWPTKFHCILD